MKKYRIVCSPDDPGYPASPGHPDHPECPAELQACELQACVLQACELLADAKRRIDRNHVRWDTLKRSSNPYELVSHHAVVRVAGVKPVSRSYFKMWELMHTFPELRAACVRGQVVSVAEGPGSFTQAMLKAGAREAHAITLVNRNAPAMRVTDPRLTIHTVDGSGDVCRRHVARAFCQAVSGASLFTADGGFDLAGQFDKQEAISTNLIRAEIALGVACLEVGGCMVIKVYDMFLPATRAVVAVLCRCFDAAYVCKPCTSRPANSERYLVCISRRAGALCDGVVQHVLHDATFPTVPPDPQFTASMDAACDAMAHVQLAHINSALDTLPVASEDAWQRQVDYARRWCEEYGKGAMSCVHHTVLAPKELAHL